MVHTHITNYEKVKNDKMIAKAIKYYNTKYPKAVMTDKVAFVTIECFECLNDHDVEAEELQIPLRKLRHELEECLTHDYKDEYGYRTLKKIVFKNMTYKEYYESKGLKFNGYC